MKRSPSIKLTVSCQTPENNYFPYIYCYFDSTSIEQSALLICRERAFFTNLERASFQKEIGNLVSNAQQYRLYDLGLM